MWHETQPRASGGGNIGERYAPSSLSNLLGY